MSVNHKVAEKGEEWNDAYESTVFPDPAVEQNP